MDGSVLENFQRYLTLEDVKWKKLYNEEDRLMTFDSWSVEFIDKEKLAMLGFYFLKPPDAVECAFCGIIISNWRQNDNIHAEHLKLSKACPLLNFRANDNVPLIPEQLDQILLDPLYNSETPRVNPNASEFCAYPQYEKMVDRLQTYDKWPSMNNKHPKELCGAGFFYTGKGDEVTCFSCGGSIKGWKEDDNIWKLHADLSHNCNYLKEQKRQNSGTNVKLVQKNQDSNTSTTSKNVSRKDNLRQCEHPKYWNKSDRLKTYQNWSYDFKKSFVELCDAGFFYTGEGDKVTCFSCGASVVYWKETDCVWQEHFKRNPDCEFLRSIKGQSFIDNMNTKFAGDHKSIDKNQKDDSKGINKNVKSEGDPPKNKSELKVEDIGEEKFCKICFIEESDTAFMPCGHMLTCSSCASCLKECPLCQKPFTSMKKIYLS